MANVYVGVLSGGAGTRLWPVSRKSYPKQFYNLSSDEPLLIETLRRVESLGEAHILTTDQLQFSTLGLLNRYHVEAKIVAEPQPKNTAPIISVFNEMCFKKNPEAIVCIFPADHAINNSAGFIAGLNKAIEIARDGNLVTLGIVPTSPSSAYGYMQLESPEPGAKSGSSTVTQFIEKPSPSKAEELIREGALWNSGIFVYKAETFRNLLKQHAPEIFSEVSKLDISADNLPEIYANLPAISIDYALMEKVAGIQCVRADFSWSDLGSWEEVAIHSRDPYALYEIDGSKNFYTGSSKVKKTVAFVGVSDVMAIDTPDALLILKKGSGQNVKKIVELLVEKKQKSGSAEEHSFEERPWGRFEVLLDTATYKSKLITVWPGQRLSYQSHTKRREHWIMVAGEGEFTLNGEKRRVKNGDYLFIPQGAKHRIANNGKEPLEFVEVQQGTYFGEDDIARFDDDYGRK